MVEGPPVRCHHGCRHAMLQLRYLVAIRRELIKATITKVQGRDLDRLAVEIVPENIQIIQDVNKINKSYRMY
jgi:hypothetical protein